jgi:two-component system response regulator FixJ
MTQAEPVVHVVDDDEAIRHSVVFQLRTAGYAERDHESAEAFLKALPLAHLGCVITDVRMPGLNGLELVRRLNELGFKAPVIMMTGHGDIPLAVEAMKAGVVDFIEKPLDDDILLRAVGTALSKAATPEQDDALKHERQARFDSLSSRERDVLIGVIAGKPNKIMAYDLGISQRTVEAHRAGLMAKTGASSLSELIRMALSLGF